MKYLYYCNSVYQFINILKLHIWRIHEGNSGDLLLQSSVPNYQTIKERLDEHKVFDHVIIFDKKNEEIKPRLGRRLKELYLPATSLREQYDITRVKNRYDVICIPKVNAVVGMLWLANKKAKIEFFEEGIGLYFDKEETRAFSSRTYKTLFGYLNNGKTFEKCNDIYMNYPEFMDDKKWNAKKIPDFNELEKFANALGLLKYVLSAKEATPFKKINWISQKTTFENYPTNDESYLDRLKTISDCVLYRPHPRFNAESYEGFEIDDINTPMEMKILRDSNCENEIFISYCSTGCFMPKILFNKEPYLILLNKKLNNRPDIESFIEKFKSTYKDAGKIYTPTSSGEMVSAINLFSNIINKK